jgi:hypothetical protein
MPSSFSAYAQTCGSTRCEAWFLTRVELDRADAAIVDVHRAAKVEVNHGSASASDCSSDDVIIPSGVVVDLG